MIYNSEPTYPDLTVNDAYDNQSWNLDLFSSDLPSNVVHQITSSSVLFSNDPDVAIWDLTTLGKFLVKSSYEALRAHRRGDYNLWYI